MRYLKLSAYLSVFALIFSLLPNSWASDGGFNGNGYGEKNGLAVQVVFQNPSGFTTTDATGIHYNLWGWYLINEGLYYNSSTWGKLFPLFFLGQTVNLTVTLTNKAPGNKHYRVHVKGLANDLLPPYTVGPSLGNPVDAVILVNSGETKTISAQLPLMDPNTPSGLDLVRIQVYNQDMGAGTSENMIGEWDSIFCPPPAGSNKK